MELVVRNLLEHHAFQNISYDIVLIVIINGDAGEFPLFLLVKLLDGLIDVSRFHYDGWCHNLFGFYSSQTDAAFDNLAF